MTGSKRRRLIAVVQLSRYRLQFAAGDAILPSRAARAAVRLWLTPPLPRTEGSSPPPGGTQTTVETGSGGSVRTVSWGVGPPIYFMHGWGGSGRQIEPMVEPLVQCGFRVVTFDAPGHGINRRRPTHAGEFGAALAAVAKHFGDPHGVIAHSLGAVAVTRAALDHGLHIGRLVLLAPLVDGSTALDGFATLLQLGRSTRPLLAAEVRQQTGLTLAQFTCHDLRNLVEGQPTLILQDPSDAFTSYADTAALARSWMNATLVPVGGLGHYRLLSDPHVVSMTVETLTRASQANATAFS